MLKNKIVVRKIRNIVILLMVILIMIGAYKNIDRSRAEKIRKIDVITKDSYGYLEQEELTLEAREIENNLYEIEIPKTVNSKKINEIVKCFLENESIGLTEKNTIQLTKAQLEKGQLYIEVAYDIALIEKNGQGKFEKILLSEKTEEERKKIEITENVQTLYNKILKYEDAENGKVVEVKGYLPQNARLEVKEVTRKELEEIFKDIKIDVAYDIKILVDVKTQIPIDEANPEAKPEEIIETIEINPEELGEKCEVTIKDTNIVANSQVYHVKEDDTYEKVNVKDSIDENISFEAQAFSIYAVSSVDERAGSSVSFSPSSGVSRTSISVTGVYSMGIIDGYVVSQSTSQPGTNGSGYTTVGIDGFTTTISREGINYLHVYIGGSYGGYGGPYIIDKTAPKYSISPESSTTWTKSKTITVTFTDAGGSGLASSNVEYRWKDSNGEIVGSGTAGGSASSRTITKQNVTGIYSLELKITATDGAQNTTTTNWLTKGPYYFDNIAPTIPVHTAYYKADNSEYISGTWTNKAVVSRISAVDEHAGVTSIQYTKTPSDSDSWITLQLEYGGGSVSKSETTYYGLEEWVLKTRDDTYYFRVVDGAGNVSEVSTSAFNIKYDLDAPTGTKVTSSSNGQWTNQDITVTMSGATDNHSGFDFYESELNTGDNVQITGSNLEEPVGENPATRTFTAETTEDTYLQVWAFDKVGNESSAVEKDINGVKLWIRIDKTAPTITFDKQSDDWAKSHTVAVTLTDALSGFPANATVQYIWSTSITAPTSGYKSLTLSNSAGAKTLQFEVTGGYANGENITGDYYLWIKTPNDRAGNSKTGKTTGVFKFDNTNPNYNFSETEDRTWRNQKSVSINVWDNHSGIKHKNNAVTGKAVTSARFEWSIEPENATDSSSGKDRDEVIKEGNLDIYKIYKDSEKPMEGIYYLGVKIWAVDMPGKDNAASLTNGFTEYTHTGPFYIDNVLPTAGTLITTAIDEEGERTNYSAKEGVDVENDDESTTNPEWTNGDVYIELVQGSDTNKDSDYYQETKYTVYHKNLEDEEYSIYINSNGETLENKTTSTTLNETGRYKIIVTTKDCAENIATREYWVYIDKTTPTRPQVTSSSNGQWTNQNITVTMAGSSDAHSGFHYYHSELNTGNNIHIQGSSLSEPVGENPATRTFTEETTEDTYLQVWALDKAKNNRGAESDINGVKLWIRIDKTKPVWIAQNVNRDLTNLKLTVDLVGTDALSGIASSSLTTDKITVYVDGEKADSIIKELDGENGNYTLTLSNFEEKIRQSGKKYKEWSGTIQIKVAGGTLTDKATNTNEENTLDIGFMDVLKPDIQYISQDIDEINDTYIMTFEVTDKYYASGELDLEDLTIKMQNGQVDSNGDAIIYDLRELANQGKVNIAFSSQPCYAKPNIKVTNTSGNIIDITTSNTYQVGHTYTLTISNLEQLKIKTNHTTADYSGMVTVSINNGVITDRGITGSGTNPNQNIAKSITSGFEMENQTNTGEYPYIPEGYTIVSGTNLNTGLVIQDGEGNQFVWVEVPQTENVYPTAGLEITSFTDAEFKKIEEDLRNYTSVYTDTAVVDEYYSNEAQGLTQNEYDMQKKKMLKSVYKNGGFYVGRYETGIDYSEGYRTESGDANEKPVIKQNAYVYDYVTTSQAQELSESFSTEGYSSSLMFSVQSNLIMKYLENKGTSQSELKTDSTSWGNYKNSLWNLTNINAKYSTSVENGYLSSPYEKTSSESSIRLTTGAIDAFSKQNIYDLAGNAWEKTLAHRTNSAYNNTPSAGGSTAYEGTQYPAFYLFGSVYDSEFFSGFRVALYKDEGVGTVVDVVDPIWQGKVTTLDLTNGNATVEIIGTDTYFDNSTLTSSNIKIFANGSEVTTGISKTLGTGTPLTETRIVNGVTKTGVQYGIKYELNVSGFPTNVNQVKIQISQGTLTDQSGNTNKANTDIIIYNVLKSTSTETGMASGFLGNNAIKREQIDQIEFYPHTENVIYATKWDVSAQGDGSIMAWYEILDNGALKVYIGSDYPMFANPDSSYLFSYIGYGANSTSEQTIIDLDLLNTTSATNMNAMFWFTGYRAMKTLDLTSLDTSNVTYMREMFTGCGYNEMTNVRFGSNFKTNKVVDMSWMFANFGYTKLGSLTLPNTFNTSSVTNMSYMFIGTGYTAMTELNFGTVFNTSNVEDMSYMFKLCGYTAMTELNLGTTFNTSKAKNMSNMFESCGYTAMTTLNLGGNFDTTLVTNMNNMFNECGYTAMTSLDLGDKFNTSNVTIMGDMFHGCGSTKMTILDLGPAFTNLSGTGQAFIEDCGKSNTFTIYAPESIYLNKGIFKENSIDNYGQRQELDITPRGTIIPIYKPQWDVIETEIVESNDENVALKITLKGNANHSETISGTNVKINYASDVTTNLIPEDISVYIEETELTNISTSVEELETTTATEIIQTITITNFKEELMQAGKNYREWSGNLTLKIDGREESSDTYSVKSLVDQYGNQYMSQTDEGQADGTWIDINFNDETETDKNTNNKLFADIIKPEIMYKYSEADIDKNLKTVKVVFSVTDKYFESSSLSISDLTVLVDGETVNWWTEADGETSTKPRKTLSEPTDVTGTVNGVENVVVGKQYTLTLTNLEQKEIIGTDKYLDYSGIVTVAIEAGKVADKSGNINERKTITMGIDLPEDADQTPVIADVVDPLWTLETDANGKLILKGTDKYLDKDNSSLDASDVTIYADLDGNGTIELIPGASVTLSNSTILTEERTIDGQKQQVPYGIQYELGLQISLDTVLTTFTDTRTSGVQSQYREDNGVNTKIKIAGGTLVDLNENTSKEQEIELNGEEVVNPEIIYKYANTIIGSGAEGNKKVTVVFDITDKRFANSNISKENLTILIDGELYGDENNNGTIDEGETGIESISTLTKKHDLYASIGGSETLVGARYELVIGNDTDNLDQGKGFDYSGILTISIPAGQLNDDDTLNVGAIDESGNLNTAKTITIGIDEPEGTGNEVIVDVVDPIWKVVSGPTVTLDANGKTQAAIEIIGTDKYFNQSTLEKNDIQIWINEQQIAGKDNGGNLITIAPELATSLTTEYVKWDSVNETYQVVSQADANGQKYIFTLSNLEESKTAFMEKLNQYLANTLSGRPYREYSGEAKIIIPSGKVVDNSGNIDNGLTVDLGKIDTLKPEIIKVSAENGTMQDPDDETKIIPIQTITFIATDKYFDTTNSLDESEIIVKINGETAESIEKDLSIIDTFKSDVNGDGIVDNAEIVGYKYQLILSDFEQIEKQTGKDFIEWSGNVLIDIKENAIKDKSLNGNELTTINGKFADFITPKVEQGTAANNISEKTQTITFKVTDKYINSELTSDDITVKINGETAESVDIANAQANKIYKDLSSTSIKYDVNRNGTVEEDEIVGYNYTLVLSNFGQTEKQTGKDFIEWSGNVSIEIAEGVIKDKGPNGDGTNPNVIAQSMTVDGKFVDFIAPKVENIEATNDPLAKTQTITFTAIDKYFDSISENDIQIRIDGEIPGDTNGNGQIDGAESLAITKSPLTTVQTFKADIDGNGTEEIIGYKYQLILSNFEQTRTSVNDSRKFVDWSGTVEVIIPDGIVKDKGPNGDGTNPNGNEEASIEKFADFIAPDIIYQYVSGDIDKTGKTFTMAFDVTDKYFNESSFATQYINAETEADKLTVLKNYLTIKVDGEDITNIDTVTKKITEISDIENTFKKTVNGTVLSGTYTIGKHFVLEISGLEQDKNTVTGDSYLDYSGVITVAIKGTTEGSGTGIATDTGTEGDGTNVRTNVATTLTSGVNIPGGVIPDDEVIVDVVDPLWQQAGSVTGKAIEQTATIPIRVTDKYIKKDASGKLVSELQSSDITVKVNGEVKGSDDGISVVVVEDTNASLTYGKQYKVTVTGFAKDATQVSITLRQGIVLDESGNGNKETTFILFSSLKETNTETLENSGFLGNTTIQRQNIEKIIFQNNLNGINDTKWKASAQDDESIMAWYESRTVSGTTLYTVYIGSNVLMNANPDSSYLFSYIGYNSNCVATSTSNPLIENIELLNVGSVTNMEGMFQYFGHKTMSSLYLGTGFDTTNVTNMSNMFKQCGYTAMTTIDLGANFNTSDVTNMSNMFNGCGSTSMTNIYFGSSTGITTGEITLPSNFNTTNVENMSGMFQDFGKGKVVKLDLGENFNTFAVTNMSNMFNGCGTSEMTTLTLGTNFNTSVVTNMSGMFQDFAQDKMTSLSLGDFFYTNSVTDMSNMFNGCGSTSMTSLDLGPAFANISTTNSGFATNLGKNGEIKVYTGEGIYLNKNAFKLNTDNATEIEYTRGQIIPKYAPIWTEKESSYDEDAQTVTIILEGKVNSNYSTSTTKTVNNLLTNGTVTTNTTTPINLRIDGVEANAVTKVISDKTTGEEVVQATITLSGFEKGRVINSYFKEWSGNIALQLARGTLKDVYGNANLAQTDESGTMENVEVKEDSATDKNETNDMFADFIKPEFTYTYSESDINHTNESVTVVFDVTDKYFDSTTLSNLDASQVTVRVADYDIVTLNNAISKQLTKTATLVMNKTTKVITVESASYIVTSEERIIGERYQLVVKELDQEDANGIGNAFDFSGHMSLAFNSGVITDKSGNTSDATTITIGLNENDGESNDDTIHGSGVIVDVVDPVWQLGDISLDEGTIKLNAIDKYFGSVTIDEDDILVYVNGYLDGDTNKNGVLDEGETTNVTKDITSTTPTDIENGKQYTLKLSNITTGGADVPFTPYNVDELNSTAGFKYGDENGGNISIKILAGTIADQYGNTSVDQSFEIGNIDATKPRVYPVQNIQNASVGTETIIFNATDRNYDSTDLITLDVDKNGDGVVDPEITVWLDGNQIDDKVVKQLTYKSIYLDAETIVGHQYTLVLSEIVETDEQYSESGRSYRELSGTIEIRIVKDAVKDIKGNILDETVKISDFIDYIKPELNEVEVINPINTTDKTYTTSFEIRDKYLDDTSEDTLKVQEDEIKVYVDGVLAPTIKKPTTVEEQESNKDKIWLEIVNPDNPEDPQPKPITATFNKTTVNGIKNGTYVVGHDYGLVLSNFEQSVKQSGKSFMEWSGTVRIVIDQDSVKDKTGNTLVENETKRTIGGSHVDFIKPVVETVSIGTGTDTETIIFDVIDKYLDISDEISEGEITVYVDKEIATLTKGLTKTAKFVMNKTTKEITQKSGNYIITDINTEQIVGERYQLVLSGFEQSSRNSKNYKDWSGTVSIEIDQNAVKDTSENKFASDVTIVGKYVDFIKPDIKYTHQSTDISKGTKSYTMTFDITDKYYTSGQIDLDDLTIKMQNGQIDSNGDAIIYDLKELATQGKINIGFNAVPYYAEPNIKITNTLGVIEEITTANTHQIGHIYTLTISNLEKIDIETGLTTADYSGIVTVAINGDVIQDRGPSGDGTNQNGNDGKTITSGVSIPGGTISNAQVVDVVKPIIDRVSSSANAVNQTAEITFKGTDTYFVENSTISVDDIKVYVNGSEVTSGITKTITATTKLEEQRIGNYVQRIEDDELEIQTANVQYGVQYTLKITGFAQNVNQIKVKIPAGKLTDQYGNSNVETDLIVYNTLRMEDMEEVDLTEDGKNADEIESEWNSILTDEFLGESSGTRIYPINTILESIKRQDIEKIEFLNNLGNLIEGEIPKVWDTTEKEWNVKTGIQRVWDVSAQGDKSILAWTSQTSAPYTIYIGSVYEIFGNQNSRYLFAGIGSGTNSTSATTISNLNLLNTSSVTNMYAMFYKCGYTSMTSLDLRNFDTSNVTNMFGMFSSLGYTAMTTFDIGENFNTSKVTKMGMMFSKFGYTQLTSLNLGDKFNTSNVRNMYYMFFECGNKLMTKLNLQENFNTSNVYDMAGMFSDCGFMEMTNLYFGTESGAEGKIIFPDNFNTSNVEKMSAMFERFGSKIVSLDLGNNFNTSNVTTMKCMFLECGLSELTNLDLGDKFDTSKVTDMQGMFQTTGALKMTSLDLGDKFYTTSVTDTSKMFYQCGAMKMTTLDLGPAFTKIAENNTDMFKNCGASELVIYAPESIYSNRTTFK